MSHMFYNNLWMFLLGYILYIWMEIVYTSLGLYTILKLE